MDNLTTVSNEERLDNVTTTSADVLPINIEAAFNSLEPAEQQEITALADSIDVTKFDNVMSYGSEVLKKTFDQCGQFLKSEKGSEADQEVIKRVVELTKKASDSYEDFEMILQETNFIEKTLLKMMSSRKKGRTNKIKTHVISTYQLLAELKKSCETWIEMLRNAMGDISYSELSDSDNVLLLEKYIIAGHLAKTRIEAELQQMQEASEETGLRTQSQKYDELKEGYDIFVLKLNNLEKSRVMYYLSLGQLKLIKRSNKNVQISVHTQADNCTTLIGQQLRNAVLNAKNQEVIEGQKALARLGDELIKDVSRSIGVTAEEAEKLLYYSIVNTDAAKEAIKTVISSCESIKRVAEEMLPKMKADVAELNGYVEELKPYIDNTYETPQNSTESTTFGSGSLKF